VLPYVRCFLISVTTEYYRQHYLMKQLTYLVECVNHRKNYRAIRNPVFNLLDSTSLLTWLDLRTLFKDIGKAYKLRMQIAVAMFGILVMVSWLMFFGHLIGYFPLKFIEPDEWIVLVIVLLDWSYPFIELLCVGAYMNKETGDQIKQFNEIRFFIQRFSTDHDLMV
jgi:hypothetical protein